MADSEIVRPGFLAGNTGVRAFLYILFRQANLWISAALMPCTLVFLSRQPGFLYPPVFAIFLSVWAVVCIALLQHRYPASPLMGALALLQNLLAAFSGAALSDFNPFFAAHAAFLSVLTGFSLYFLRASLPDPGLKVARFLEFGHGPGSRITGRDEEGRRFWMARIVSILMLVTACDLGVSAIRWIVAEPSTLRRWITGITLLLSSACAYVLLEKNGVMVDAEKSRDPNYEAWSGWISGAIILSVLCGLTITVLVFFLGLF